MHSHIQISVTVFQSFMISNNDIFYFKIEYKSDLSMTFTGLEITILRFLDVSRYSSCLLKNYKTDYRREASGDDKAVEFYVNCVFLEIFLLSFIFLQ